MREPRGFLPEVHDTHTFRGPSNLSRFTGPKLRGNLKQHGAVGPYVRAPKAGSRHVIIKVGIISGSTKTPLAQKTAVHFRYVERDGAGEHGKPAELIGPSREPPDVKAFQHRTAHDPHQFHFIVSPRDGDRLDMPRLTRELMDRMARDIQRPIDWVASIHYNTAHPHAHITIRGRDLEERDLYLTKSYLFYGLRYRAMNLATSYLGRDRSPTHEQARALEQLEQFTHAHTLQMKRVLDDPSTGHSLGHTSPQTREGVQQRAGIARAYVERHRHWAAERTLRNQGRGLEW